MTTNESLRSREEVAQSECGSCGESDAVAGECPKSERPCGHHCNHIWTHDACDWCGLDLGDLDRIENLLVEYDEGGQLFGESGAGAYFLAKFLTDRGVTPRAEGCDCASLCSMGPTCPGGSLAGLPGSGCSRIRSGMSGGGGQR